MMMMTMTIDTENRMKDTTNAPDKMPSCVCVVCVLGCEWKWKLGGCLVRH